MKIENEFIPYEQALALKELDFDEPCFAYFYHHQEYKILFDNPNQARDYNSIRIDVGGIFDYDKDRIKKGLEILGDSVSRMTSIPTFSQAFRWFREKHNIQGYIYSSTVRGNSEKTKQFTGYIWNINGIDMPFISTDARDELHDTYEEAELACLIKLIEIVKTK